MVCSAWFRERLRKASLKKENDQDIDIKSKEHTSEGIVILNNGYIYILENPYGVGLNIKITLKDFYKIETDDGKNATVDDVLNIRIEFQFI